MRLAPGFFATETNLGVVDDPTSGQSSRPAPRFALGEPTKSPARGISLLRSASFVTGRQMWLMAHHSHRLMSAPRPSLASTAFTEVEFNPACR